MRKGIILIGGLCVSFCLMWYLCTRLTSEYYTAEPVLSVLSTVDTQSVAKLQFPFKIPGTTLIAEQIVSFDGLFTEGDEPYDVTDVAALLLYNDGKRGITDAEICLKAGQVQYTFVAEMIPAGARLLVPEQNAMEYGPNEFNTCSGKQTLDKANWNMDSILKLEYPQIGEVVVKNLTDQSLTEIFLYYKSYYEEGDFYVGGKTQRYYISLLEAGENIRIYPHNYALGYSRFVGMMTGTQ